MNVNLRLAQHSHLVKANGKLLAAQEPTQTLGEMELNLFRMIQMTC